MKNRLVFTFNIILIITIFQNNLASQTLFEIAKKYANIIYKYDELDDYNKYIFDEKGQIIRNKDFDANIDYDSLGKIDRLQRLSSEIDTMVNFREVQVDIKTNTTLKYFKFTDIRIDAIHKPYLIAIDSNYIIYKLANFKKQDFDIFYRFELQKDSLNYLKFLKLYYNDIISFTDIHFVGIDITDIVKAKFNNLSKLVYEERIGYISIKGNITTLTASSLKKLNYKLYQYEFKFFEDRFEENNTLIDEEIVNRKSTR